MSGSAPNPLPALQQEEMKQILAKMQIPQIFFNGYANGHTLSEVTSIISFSDRPTAMLVMSPETAKSFALSILDTIKGYEAATNKVVETLDILGERISKYLATEQK